MLKDSHLSMVGPSAVAVTCDAVALDPSHPATVYAAFEASKGGSIPPLYNVAFVTTNMGRNWRFVPPPHGDSLTDFAGFVEREGGVEVLFSQNIYFSMKSAQSAEFSAATSSTGGRSWIERNLDCSGVTPCVTFGPQAPQGACGMSEWEQSVLVGDLEEATGADLWRAAGSDSTVAQCGTQQLVATSSQDVFLVDRHRPTALLYTRDGIHWTSVQLPKIDGAAVGGTFAPFGQVMTLAANGDLVTVAVSPLQSAEHLEILRPRSNTWCAARLALPAGTKNDPVTAVQSSESRLAVAFFSPVRTGQEESSALTIPLSSLSCRT